MKILRAKDLMHRDVAYVRPEMSIMELASFLEEEGIQGAPVVDGEGKIVGVVSKTDLVRAFTEEEEEAGQHHPFFLALNEEGEEEALPTDLGDGHFPGTDLTVSEIMSPTILTAEEEWTAGEIADMMIRENVRRIIITEDGRVKGILTATDLLSALPKYETILDGPGACMG